MTASLKAVGVGKRFPGVVALEGVDLEIKPGCVLALVGANGAGKSTLIKILTGYYDHYEGQISLGEQPLLIHEPSDASRVGIHAVYQEVDTVLVPTLTVSENLLLDEIAEGKTPIFIQWSRLHQRATQVMERIGLHLKPDQRVENLVLHEKQMLVIARAVSQQVRFLIFDEPTTSLSAQETERLFEVIRALKAQGVGIIYISHRLREVADIADEIVVLRNGRKITQFPVAEFDLSRISEAMLGTALTEFFPPKSARSAGEVILEAKGLYRAGVLDRVSFTARKGEVLGIAGLVGAGKTELLRTLFGADPLEAGEIHLAGRSAKIFSPQQAVTAGIYLVPEERRSQGVLVEQNVQKNISLPFMSQFTRALGLLNTVRERQHATGIIQRLGLTPPNPDTEVKNLSGGNQQKVVIGKWLSGNAEVILFDEATQGIDVRAKRDIYQIVRDLSQDCAILFASSDIDEIVGLADRAIVMRDGAIAAELQADQLDRAVILEYATGVRAPMLTP